MSVMEALPPLVVAYHVPIISFDDISSSLQLFMDIDKQQMDRTIATIFIRCLMLCFILFLIYFSIVFGHKRQYA